MTTVLLTGFEPFGGDRTNPAGEAVHLVAARWRGPEQLVTAVLPVTFAGAAARLRQLIAEHEPHLILGCGLAGGREKIGVERIAVNLRDARIPDNAGAQPVDEPSVAGAPAAHFATIPVKAVTRAIAAAGIPVELSWSAGTFVCNDVFFTARDAAPGTRVGFLHVPWAAGAAPEGAASLPLDALVRALEIAIRVALDTSRDDAVPGGALH